jgi:hypothetical protein
MKKREMGDALIAMRSVKVQRLENKDLRAQFIRVHLKLLEEQKKYDIEMEDRKIVFLAAWGEEQSKVIKLEAMMKAEPDPAKKREIALEIETHRDYLDAVKGFNDTAAEMGREEVEVETFDRADFIADYEKQGYDPSVVEGLFPLLV